MILTKNSEATRHFDAPFSAWLVEARPCYRVLARLLLACSSSSSGGGAPYVRSIVSDMRLTSLCLCVSLTEVSFFTGHQGARKNWFPGTVYTGLLKWLISDCYRNFRARKCIPVPSWVLNNQVASQKSITASSVVDYLSV